MRLKVLILTNLFPTPWDPRRSAFNRQQFERLGQRHDVHVLTSVDLPSRLRAPRSEVTVPGLHTDHFTYVYPPRVGRSLHAACWFSSLVLQRGLRLRAARYDCILASWAYPDGVAAGWLARVLGVPYAVKVHGSDLNQPAQGRLRKAQVRASLRGAGAVVAVSRALADKAVAIGADPSTVHTVYNGVDGTRFAPGTRQDARVRLGLSPTSPLLLYVGNLKASKGCIDLLDALPGLLASRPQARLVYAGEGPCRDDLQRRAQALGVAERVDLIGAVDHADLADWYRAADVLCLPSHSEGVPNVVLEAMACGTPVVATRVGGIPEVLPDYAGLLVPAHAPDALAEALREATERSWDCARITAHAAGFRWDTSVDRLDRVLQAVAARRAVALPSAAR